MKFPSVHEAESALSHAWRWPYFSIQELACRCARRFCEGAYWHAPDFLDALEQLRAKSGRALVITSGHRCAQWNAAVGGAPHSQHKTIAVDISLRRHDRHVLRTHALTCGFTGIGLARSFIHLDRRGVPALWYYKGSQSLWQI